MPVTPAIKPDNAPENIKKIYDRVAETIGGGEVPVGYQMMGHVESYLQDSYMNFRKFMHDGTGKLDEKQRTAISLATSSAMNCSACVRSHVKHAKDAGWTDEQTAEILAVTATCAMYNTYYKFRDLAGDKEFEKFQVGLRAHTFVKVSLGDPIVELINVVVSNINGCPTCTSGHVQKAISLGMTHEQIDEAIRISATIVSFNTYHRTQ